LSAHTLALTALGDGTVRVDVYSGVPGDNRLLYDGGLPVDPIDDSACRDAARWLEAILRIEPARVLRQLFGKDLQSHLAAQAQVCGDVNLSHAPGPEGRGNLEGAQAGAGWKCRDADSMGCRPQANSRRSTLLRSFGS